MQKSYTIRGLKANGRRVRLINISKVRRFRMGGTTLQAKNRNKNIKLAYFCNLDLATPWDDSDVPKNFPEAKRRLCKEYIFHGDGNSFGLDFLKCINVW